VKDGPKAVPIKGIGTGAQEQWNTFQNEILIDTMHFNRRVHNELSRVRRVCDGLFTEKQTRLLNADLKQKWAANKWEAKKKMLHFFKKALRTETKESAIIWFNDFKQDWLPVQQHRSVTALMDRLGRCFEELNFDPHRFEKIIEVTSTDDLFEDQVQRILAQICSLFSINIKQVKGWLKARHVHWRLRDDEEPKPRTDDDELDLA
jgi:hypothetical protein